MCVKIIASQRRDVFWDTVYMVHGVGNVDFGSTLKQMVKISNVFARRRHTVCETCHADDIVLNVDASPSKSNLIWLTGGWS